MISSREDYAYYLMADKLALEKNKKGPAIIGDDIWKFERSMRKLEYYTNCKKSLLWKPYVLLLSYFYYRLSVKLGFSIPINVFGPGLSIAHRGTIVVNPATAVGDNCRLHTCVIIGTKAGYDTRAPRIGHNVYIGPGVKIFGDVSLADDIAIGANAVVNRSFEEPGVTIAGAPAAKVSDKGSKGLLVRATEILNKNGRV
jgi:serine O-acetyltransferase